MGQRSSSWYLGLLLVLLLPSLSGCIVTYGIKSGIGQFKILNARRPISEVIKDPNTPEDVKEKLIVAQKAREFAEANLGFKSTRNYTHYVQLDRPYVTWIVSKAHKYKLEYELFSFPIVGNLPYKGYFTKDEALEAEKEVDKSNYDTWVRGVSAYSTLGWFQDPILSTMLKGSQADVVELVLHESAHATLYIESAADFNEQLATYLGQESARRFFVATEGKNSKSIEQLEIQRRDQNIFSEFLKKEMDDLRKWYLDQKEKPDEKTRQARFEAIQVRFNKNVSKKLKSKRYDYFPKIKLNNAILLGMGTYLEDLSIFSDLMNKKSGNMIEFIEYCRSLSKTPNPSEALKDYLSLKP